MPKIDVDQYMAQCGMRRARFGGLDTEDVRQAMLALCGQYEQALAGAEAQNRDLQRKYTALERHCQALAAKNQALNSRNLSLAGDTQRLSVQQETMDHRLSILQTRNQTLNDQCARLRLKNSDMTRENTVLQERAEQAEALLRLKAKDLDEALAEVAATRQSKLDEAEAEAARLVQDAKSKAQQIEDEARLTAEAVTRAAHEQAQAQARKLVAAAIAETNEVQSAHRLRLQDIQAQIDAMEKRRAALVEYLAQVGGKLLQAEEFARENLPAPPPPELPEEPEPVEEVKPMAVPEPELDLSDAVLADTANRLREEAHARAKQAAASGPQQTNLVIDPELEPDPAAKGITLVQEEPSAPREIPGAIFSYPIVRKSEEEVQDEPPPAAGPRAPVMPQLPPEDEEEEIPPLQILPITPTPEDPRRQRAIFALRALRRRMKRAGL